MKVGEEFKVVESESEDISLSDYPQQVQERIIGLLKRLVDEEPLQRDLSLREIASQLDIPLSPLQKQMNKELREIQDKSRLERIRIEKEQREAARQLKEKERRHEKELKESAKERALRERKEEAEEIYNQNLQTRKFIQKYPFIYDSNKIWWLWSSNDYKWVRVDDVEILNIISKKTKGDVTRPLERQIIINTMKQEGRKDFNKIKKNNPYWIQFRNKIIDIETSEEFEATPEFFITNPIPWDLGDSEDTPTIDRLLREWVVFDGVQDESFVNTLYEIIAYSILPSAPMQRIICLVGFGANGKSTYLNLIKMFIGSENTASTELSLLSTRFESAKLYLKLVAFVGEIDKGIFQQTALLKRISGGDVCRIEFKGKDGFDSVLYCKPMIACNNLPETSDKSIGFFRRWLIIDFLNKFEKQKDVLKTIPKVEFNNLARKSVRILQELLLRGSFTNEGSFEERKAKYELHANPLDFFINDTCNYNFEEKIDFQEFYNIYQDWLKNNGYHSKTKRDLGISIQNNPRLKKVLFKINKDDGSKTTKHFIKGIEFREKEAQEVEEDE